MNHTKKMKGMGAALKSGLKIIGGIMNNTVLEFECVGMDNGGKFPIEYTIHPVQFTGVYVRLAENRLIFPVTAHDTVHDAVHAGVHELVQCRIFFQSLLSVVS